MDDLIIEGDYSYICPDDLLDAYAQIDSEQRSAVSNLMAANGYLSLTACRLEGKENESSCNLDWRLDPVLCLHLLKDFFKIALKEYGAVWVRQLQDYLSQMK